MDRRRANAVVSRNSLGRGIDHQRFKRDPSRKPTVRAALGIAEDRIVIGAVGRLEREKRFDLLIDAAAALTARHPGLAVLIAGDGSLRGPAGADRHGSRCSA